MREGASRRPQGVPSPQRGKEKMGCEDAGMVANQRWRRRCWLAVNPQTMQAAAKDVHLVLLGFQLTAACVVLL